MEWIPTLTKQQQNPDNSRDGFLDGEWRDIGHQIWQEIQRMRRPGLILVKVHHDRENPKVIEADVQNNLIKVKLS